MKVRNMVECALFAALMTICAWISLPIGGVPVTLQTFGLYLTLLVLGGKWGSISIGIYLCLGFLGLPVFSGFQGGAGVLLGPTGGFLFGFMLTALLYWLIVSLLGRSWFIKLISLIFTTFISYFIGFLWFSNFSISSFWLFSAPFILPDLGKLGLAIFLAKRLNSHRKTA